MLKFIKEYLKHPLCVGSLLPSGRKLAKSMVQEIDFANCRCIVEYGPGTGVFTKEILKNKREETLFLIIEQNKAFYRMIADQYEKLPGVLVVHGDAQHILNYLMKYGIEKVDYVVSGLPFATLPVEVSNCILMKSKVALGSHGTFITFQYTLLKKALFEKYFQGIKRMRVLKNLPPAHVLIMKNKEIDYSPNL
jgi:phospholipid N-methyltransferase